MLTKTSAGALSARILVVGVVLLALSTGLACAAGRITAVNVANKTDCVIITVQGDSPLKYTPIASKQGSFMGFQFPCSLAAKGRLVGIKGGGIYNVRYSNFSSRPPLTRIVVNTYKGLNYSTDWAPDRRRVEITVLKHGVKTAKASKPQALVPAATPVEQVVPSTVETPQSQPIEAVTAPKPRRLDRSAYAAIAAKSRIRRMTAPVAQIQTKPEVKPEPVAQKPVVAAAPEPAPVKVKRTLDRSAYKSIAAKSRAKRAPVVVASAALAVGQEPTVKVLGVVETEKAPVEPVLIAAAGQPGRVIAQPPTAPRVAAAAPTASNVSDGRRVSLNFLGADINDVLKAISMQSGQNVVASKDVTGNITLSLSNVTVDEALDYVAKLSGYTYARADETYLVSSKDSIAKLANGTDQGYVTETIKLNYMQPDDVISFAKPQFPDIQFSKIGIRSGDAKAAKSSIGLKNALLVLTGPDDQVEAAKHTIQMFEDNLKVQSVESIRATYRIKHVDPSELADTLAQLVPSVGVAFAPSEGFRLDGPAGISVNDTGSTVASGGGQKSSAKHKSSGDVAGKLAGIDGEAADNLSFYEQEVAGRPVALIIVGRESDVQRTLKLAEELDVKSPQIKIEAKITSINKSAEKNLGIKWDWSELGLFEGFTDYVKQTADRDFAPEGENMQNTRKSHSKWYRQPFDIAATLDALIEDGNGEVLAAPTMVCMEGKPSVFFVGDEVTYIQRIEVTPTGQNITTDTKQVGVQLRAIGTTSPDGFITLNLHPEVSVLKLSVDQGVNLPIVTRRFTDHVVRVKDGQTLVIGGLIRSDDIIEMSKVPLLGDLPFLGKLFRHSHTSKASTEVVMFITASILKD